MSRKRITTPIGKGRGTVIPPSTPKFIPGLRGKYKNLPLMETLQMAKHEEKDR